MTDPAFFDGAIKILFVCVLITAAYIITTKNLISLVRVYALQSLVLVAHSHSPSSGTRGRSSLPQSPS